MSERDLWCSWLPLFHDMGLVGSLFSTLYWGAGFSLFSPAEFVRNPLSWIEQVAIDRATITVAPQFAYTMCVQKAALSQLPADAYDLSNLRLVLNGAEAVDVAVCEDFERSFARFGLHAHAVQPCYGLAENCVAVSVRVPNTPRVAHHFDRTALHHGRVELCSEPSTTTLTRAGNGFAIDGTQVAVLDADDRALPDGGVGEIAIAGDATARAILRSDGEIVALPEWVRTGDLGVMLDGELYVVGRVKEVVKRGGETFSPTDIEACASAEARVAGQRVQVTGVAAFGFRDEANGCEEVVVVAETRDYRHDERSTQLAQQLRLAVLREFRLPLYDVIIARPGTIPRTTSGKTQRLTLRDRYLQGELKAVAQSDA
jgi:acyl-CoA synthetase (AMP-forming)/AMP-acid ligase II